MNFLKMYFGGYKKGIIFRIFIFLQVCIAAFSINLALGNFEFSKQIEKIPSDDMKIHGVIINATNERMNNIDESIINQTIRNLPGIDKIGEITTTNTSIGSNANDIRIYSYPDFMFTGLNDFKLTKGNKNDYGYHNGVNYVFVSSDSLLEYGKEYECNIHSKNVTEPVKVKIKVTGIYDKNTYLLNFSSSSSDGIPFRNIYQNQNEKSLVCNEIRDSDGNVIILFPQYNTAIKLKSDVNINDVKETWEKSLSGHAVFSTMSETIEKSRDQDFEKGKKTYSVAIVLIVLCLIGVGSGAIIKILNESKEYGIYFMCGQVWSRCIVHNALSNIIDVIIPFTLGFIIAKLFSVNHLAYSLISTNNVFYSFLMVLSIFIITGAWSMIYLAKTPPISFLRRNKS